MKPILAVLALVLTSTLFAQEPGRRPVRETRPQGTEQEAPRPRDERANPPRERMRGERTRSDAEQENGPGGARRPGHGRPPRGGRGEGQGPRGPRHRNRGGMDGDRAKGSGDALRGDAMPILRGVRPEVRDAFRERVRERMQDLRTDGRDRAQLRMVMQRRMEMAQRFRALEGRRARGGRAV